VSAPDVRSPEEARAYLEKLQRILRYIGVSKVNLEEGNFRCDANVSLRPAGATELGAKVEVKNMNSFRSVERALRFEIDRQSRALDEGERIPQETRGWVEGEQHTVSQRSKEEAHDYRYFPEPDLPPVALTSDQVDDIRRRLPELPDAKYARFQREYGLTSWEAEQLVESRAKADYFEQVIEPERADGAALARTAKQAANWMIRDLTQLLHAAGMDITGARVSARDLHAMIGLIDDGTITATIAKSVLEEMFASGKPPAQIIKERGLEQISASGEIEGIVETVIAANPKAVADYRAGKQEAVKYLVGQAMRETRGRANPATLTQILTAKLDAES
jgi:aspartyl-tRNA(Asn)/glutamyl-tRNA(Gln) amidotransferase subunit B